jgi:hypothetical protein
MKGLPSELIYVLIFVGILLVQYLMKRLASRRPQESSQDAQLPQAADGELPDFAGLERATSMAGSPSRASVEPLGRSEAPAASRLPPRRRFTRQVLLGTRRDVQNAIVLAAIIGPCRALEPPGGAAVPTSARRSSQSRQQPDFSRGRR